MQKTRKILALLICIAMCISLFPTWAFADEGGESPAEEFVNEDNTLPETPAAAEPEPVPVSELEDGTYDLNIAMEGGSGRASVTSPSTANSSSTAPTVRASTLSTAAA